MNKAMLSRLKAHHQIVATQHNPISLVTILELCTKYNGQLTGLFYTEECFYYANDGSCCMAFFTKDAIYYLDINDILSFCVVKSMSFEEHLEWRKEAPLGAKQPIGF